MCAGGKRIDDHMFVFLEDAYFFCTKYAVMNRNEDNWVIRQDLAS